MTTQGKQTLFLTADEVAAMPGRSKRTPWRPLSVVTVPIPVGIGCNSRWRLGERTEWIER